MPDIQNSEPYECFTKPSLVSSLQKETRKDFKMFQKDIMQRHNYSINSTKWWPCSCSDQLSACYCFHVWVCMQGTTCHWYGCSRGGDFV